MSKEIYNEILECKKALDKTRFTAIFRFGELRDLICKKLANVLKKLETEEESIKKIMDFLTELQDDRGTSLITTTRIRQLIANYEKNIL